MLKAMLEHAAGENQRSVGQEAEWRLERSFCQTGRDGWTSPAVALPPKDGTWSMFVSGSFDGIAFRAWSETDGEWVEIDCRNTGWHDEHMIRDFAAWMFPPRWFPLVPVE